MLIKVYSLAFPFASVIFRNGISSPFLLCFPFSFYRNYSFDSNRGFESARNGKVGVSCAPVRAQEELSREEGGKADVPTTILSRFVRDRMS